MWNRQAGRKVRAIASDGKVRTATFTAEADSFFTVPARMTVHGRTVTGHVTAWEGDLWEYPGIDAPEGVEYAFTAHSYRKNGDALPAWPKAVLRA